MATTSTVYEKTYKDYLSRLNEMDWRGAGEALGGEFAQDEIVLPLFGESYRVSPKGIFDPLGNQPTFDICVVLSKYLLLCEDPRPPEKDWVNFRDLRNSGPLTVYFKNDVERAISNYFSGKLDQLKEAGQNLGGRPPDIEASYDLSLLFTALPKVPVVLLFNDGDDEFPAKCSLLFERQAERYLDAECLSMVGRHLFSRLKKQAKDSPVGPPVGAAKGRP